MRGLSNMYGWVVWMVGCAISLSTGCVSDVQGEDADGEDEIFLAEGKADSVVAEWSRDACGVVSVANGASLEALDDEVGLDRRAATHIVAYRDGADGAPGTDDDQAFDSLAELDAVKYVGPRAFRKLLEHVRGNGLGCEFRPVEVQVLTISDYHGQLDPLSVSGVGNVGGAAVLSAWFRNERSAHPRTLTLTAGDAFGASPPLSSFFEEEPTVLAMNAMGFDADGLGNHNFDRGTAHLEQMARLAEHPFLAANLENVDEAMSCPGKPDDACVRPYHIFDVDGVRVGVVGVVNDDAHHLVRPGSFGPITITDPARAAQAAREQMAGRGAQVFVVIAHMGATAIVDGHPVGPLIDFANAISGFDLIVGDHTNVQVDTIVNGQRVVENKSFGATFARVRITVDRAAREAEVTSVDFVTPLESAVAPDPAIVELLAPYRAALAAAFDGRVAVATDVFVRGSNVERLREVPIGNLLADSMRLRYGTQVAFTNGGGIRAPLPSSYAPADTTLRRPAAGYAAGPPWDLVVGDFYTVLPFGNSVVTRTVTGQQLWAVLEHSVEALPGAAGFFGQISGLRFTFDSRLPAGSRVLSVTLDDGTAVAPDATRYTFATSDFIDEGGDGYGMLAHGDGISRDKMAEVLLEHARDLGTLVPVTDGRITDVATVTP